MGAFYRISTSMTITVRPFDGYFAALCCDGRILPQVAAEMNDPAAIPVIVVEYSIAEAVEQSGFSGVWNERQQVWEVFDERSQHHAFADPGSMHYRACEMVRDHYGEELPERRPRYQLTLSLWAATAMRAENVGETNEVEGFRGLTPDDLITIVQRYVDLAHVRNGNKPANSVVLFQSHIGERQNGQ
jgi:hypothetical protein